MTATDREGASSTAEAEITVTPVAVNLAPSVTLEATPQTGTTPVDVSFSAAGVDPEGGALDYRWTFGEPEHGRERQRGGNRYRGRGSYPARVPVTDSEGARGSAELEIAVTRRGGS